MNCFIKTRYVKHEASKQTNYQIPNISNINSSNVQYINHNQKRMTRYLGPAKMLAEEANRHKH